MTTIAYHKESGLIAVDTLSTRNGVVIDSRSTKFMELKDGSLALMCGAPADYKSFFVAYDGSPTDMQNPDALAFILRYGKVYRAAVTDGVYWEEEVHSNDAHGSGADFALAAMDFGAGAKEAVEYAMTRDTKTGGVAIVFDVKTGKVVAQ